MANFRSEDELDDLIPDMMYQCISIVDADVLRRDNDLMKCKLCKNYHKCFYCTDCVRNGDFTHSVDKSFERFADKKPKKYQLDEEKASILKSYEERFAKKIALENLKQNITRSKERIGLLKKCIKQRKDEILKNEKLIQEKQEKKAEQMAQVQKLKVKNLSLARMKDGEQTEVDLASNKLKLNRCALKTLTRHRVKELVNHIFPIKQMQPKCTSKSTTSSDNGHYSDLEDAQKTTYIQGQWVIAASPSDDLQYSVVEPCLPCTGDYSTYAVWCTDHVEAVSRDNLSDNDRQKFDSAYGISAALAYTAQMVNILSIYFDVHLPKRSNFMDFCRFESPEKFLHNVAKLNANVVHLCLSQKVNIEELRSHRTISNLLLVLDPQSKLMKSRSISFEEKEEILESLEDSINKDLLHADESDDDMEAEFVHISDEEDMSEEVPSESPPNIQPSFVSSVVSSLWRAATGT